MRKLIEKAKSLVRDDEGATMVEYAIMVALIAIVALLAVQTLGGKVSTTFTSVGDKMP